MSDAVLVEGATKRYGARAVVSSAGFQVARGHVLALLGPSGSGKSTLLRLIAGLERLDEGRILLGEALVSSPMLLVPPEQRRVGYVFQSFALFPHLSVEENVAFSRRDRRDPARVRELLALVHLLERRTARVHELSGGEQQRVALARALAMEPSVVLLDEPFANLDASLRRSLRDEVATTLRAREATAILVTHDAAEAFALADHVAVITDGAILQHGTPEEVYARSASRDIAARTGEIVELPGVLDDHGVTTCLGHHAIATSAPLAGANVVAVVRPEQIVVAAAGTRVRVRRRVFEGASTSLVVAVTPDDGLAQLVTLRAPGALAAREGDELRIGVRGPVLAFPAAG